MLLGMSSGVGVLLIVVVMFIVILINNLFGLVPYVFTATSHFLVTVAFALPMWMGLMAFG